MRAGKPPVQVQTDGEALPIRASCQAGDRAGGGLQTIRIFREVAPTVPIIAMSGVAVRDQPPLPEFFQNAIDLGAACCLCRPFRTQKLLKAVDMCLSFRSVALLDAQVQLVRDGFGQQPFSGG